MNHTVHSLASHYCTLVMYEKHSFESSYQVSLVVCHPRGPDDVILFPPPVAEAPEEIIGQESVDGISDDVDVHGLIRSEPDDSPERTHVTIYHVIPSQSFMAEMKHTAGLVCFHSPHIFSNKHITLKWIRRKFPKQY